MDVLLILNNQAARNVRVMVQLTDPELKERVISLLKKDQGSEAFDALVKNSEPHSYYPPGTEIPRKSMLITLDEELIKARYPKSLQKIKNIRVDTVSKNSPVCYT